MLRHYRGGAVVAFSAGFLFASAACASLVVARWTHGDGTLAWLTTMALMAGALVLLSSTSIGSSGLVAAQLLGVAGAIVVTHLLIGRWDAERLVEGPAQLVNDAVLTLTILSLVWSFRAPRARGRAGTALFSFLTVGGYALTAPWWHMDPFPGDGVQHIVVEQVLATATGLFVLFILQARD